MHLTHKQTQAQRVPMRMLSVQACGLRPDCPAFCMVSLAGKRVFVFSLLFFVCPTLQAESPCVSGEADRQVPPVLKNIYSLTHRHTQSHAPISRLSHLPSPEAPPSCASRETFTLYSSHRIGVIPRQFMEFWIVWFHFFFTRVHDNKSTTGMVHPKCFVFF